MLHQEDAIEDNQYRIKVDVTTPEYESHLGIVLLHGGIVNRKSLSRKINCLANHIGQKVNAYTITPDLFGETKIKTDNHTTLENLCHIIDRTINHLQDEYGVQRVVCFGHSMGSIILADIVNEIAAIDAIVTYGGPTNADCNGFLAKHIIRILERNKAEFHNHIDFHKFLFVFDKETRRYLKNEIMINSEYNCQFNKFNYDFHFVRDLIDLTSDYTDRIHEWGKPALFMFGTEDRITSLSKRHFPNQRKMQNVTSRHIPNGHHITPCRKETTELSKLHPFIDFIGKQARACDRM
jgi:pimeloyl-ACP methyl ester carboxylesterase